MKHKFYYSIPTACILMLILFTTSQAKAQQPTDSQPANVSRQIAKGDPTAIYTYKVFQAPNKMYGFDILKNSKFIFHQPASPMPSNSYHPALVTKENAEKAAELSIEKIKKGQTATLTDNELKKIVTQ